MKMTSDELRHMAYLFYEHTSSGYDIICYSDGACSNNPGKGGSACAFFARRVTEPNVNSDSDSEFELESDSMELAQKINNPNLN